MMFNNGGTMRQLIIKANGCHDCPIKTLNMNTLEWKCAITLNNIEQNVRNETFHKDCPMVEINNE
jgi:hypothetical protein